MTIAFYEKLGFEIAFRTVNEAADERVAFLKLGTLVIETYENKAAALKPGAIDHVAIDVKNIEKVHEMITGAGLNTTQDEVDFLDRKSTRLNSSHPNPARMPSSA